MEYPDTTLTTIPSSEWMKLEKNVTEILPRAILHHDASERFFIFNTRYVHNIKVYDHNVKPINKVDNEVYSSTPESSSPYSPNRGAPIAGTFTHHGAYLWVTHYQMYGKGFVKPGVHKCEDSRAYQNGFVTKINTQTLKLEAKIDVGLVPEHIIATPDNRWIIVANRCNGDIYIIDPNTHEIVKQIPIGKYPGGLAVSRDAKTLYITLTETSKLATVNLTQFDDTVKTYPLGLQQMPMAITTDPQEEYIYIAMSASGKVAKVQIKNDSLHIIRETYVGRAPRAMTWDLSGPHLYVANFLSNSVKKLYPDQMVISDSLSTPANPIGIAWDESTRRLWVASLKEKSISVYEEQELEHLQTPITINMSNSSVAVNSQTGTATPSALFTTSPDTNQYAETEPFGSPPISEDGLPNDENSDPFTGFTPSLERTASESDSLFHVILGSFSEKANAEKFIAELLQKGYEAEVLSDLHSNFRVSIGTYFTGQNAREAKNDIQSNLGVDAWIKKEYP